MKGLKWALVLASLLVSVGMISSTALVASPPPRPKPIAMPLLPSFNDFVIEQYYTDDTMLISTDMKDSVKFVAQRSATLDKFRVYIYKKGTSMNWSFRLETDSNGVPSGTLAWAGAEVQVSITSSKWWTIDTTNGDLTAGTIYHIVVSPLGTPDENNYININSTSPKNERWINRITTNNERNVLHYDGTMWTTLDREPVYVLEYADAVTEGDPYYEVDWFGVYKNQFQGEEILVFPQNMTLVDIQFYVRKDGNPTDSLYVVIENITDNSVIFEGVLATPGEVTENWSWEVCGTPGVRLVAGKSYRFYLKSPGSDENNGYDINWLDTYNQDFYAKLSYDGQNSCGTWSSDGGLTWSIGTARADDVAFRGMIALP